MGLTIDYIVEFAGSARQLETKLQGIRQKCMDLPFENVGDTIDNVKITKNHIKIYNWLQNQTRYPNNSRDNLGMRDLILKMLGLDTWTLISAKLLHPDRDTLRPTQYISLALWPGDGCEACDLGFFKSNKVWRCRAFCKTQYATHFVQCHLLVIKMLDLLKESGFTVEVHDEGHFWDTRNLKTLADNINDYTALIKNIFGELKTSCDKNGFTLQAPIATSENYLKVTD